MGYDYQNQVCTPSPAVCSPEPDWETELPDQDELGNQAVLDQLGDQCVEESDPVGALDQVCEEVEAQVCEVEEQAPVDGPVCEDPATLVCEEVEEQVCEVGEEIEQQQEVCEIPQVSRPLDQIMGEAMRGRGADQTGVDNAWGSVQRETAAAYGRYFEDSGAAQRSVYSMLDAADTLDGLMPGMGSILRSAALATVQVQLQSLRAQAIDSVVASTMGNLSPDQSIDDPCLEAQIRAQVEAQFAANAFDPSTISGSSQDIRFALTSGFDAQRTAVQRSMEGMAGTRFQQYVTGDANGLHMEMLTQSDYDARLTRDEGTGAARMDAGHLHATGVAGNGVTANENMQTMLRDMYHLQTTSNVGRELTGQLVSGQGQNFDTRYIAGNTNPAVDGDSFLNNRVDVADLHDPNMVPNRVARAGDRGPIDVQSTGSAYVHFMAERQYDAQNSATDMGTIEANETAFEAQRTTLQTRQTTLQTQFSALSAADQAAINSGTGALSPAGQAWVASATTFQTDLTTFQTGYQAHTNAFNNRFRPSHAHGIQMENAYNREQGLQPTSRS